MDNDAREIYEAVLGEVKKDLLKIAPQYEERILLSVEQKVMGQLSELVRKNEELEGQLNTLKAQISISENEMDKIAGETTNTALTFEAFAEADRVIDMLQYYRMSGFEFNGWIYYANASMGNFMYKIRTNGKDAQQVTDYSVGSMHNAKVKNGKLFFEDCDYREHSIDL